MYIDSLSRNDLVVFVRETTRFENLSDEGVQDLSFSKSPPSTRVTLMLF